jgi:RNA polymerase sigma-70 factor (ECF subfamily)
MTFSDLYTQYYKNAFLFVKSYVRDSMAAEDIVSDSLIDFWQAMKREQVEFPLALLLTILRNRTLNYLKHQDVKQEAMRSISSEIVRDLGFRIATLEACDPQEVFSTEIIEIVEKTLQTLPERTRRIFEMSRYEHLSVKEIAEKLSTSPKNVEYHITRSLKILRIELREYLL